MRKVLLISAAAVFVCAIISITVSSLDTGADAVLTEKSYADAAAQEIYILKEYKGLVAVFKEDGEVPIKITQTKVDTLPPYDAQKLDEGIAVEGEEKLREILMDFCS